MRLLGVASDVGRHVLLGPDLKFQVSASRQQGAFCNLSHGRQVEQVEQFTIHSGPGLPHLIPRVMPVTLVGTGKMKFDAIRLVYYPWRGLGSSSVLFSC